MFNQHQTTQHTKKNPNQNRTVFHIFDMLRTIRFLSIGLCSAVSLASFTHRSNLTNTAITFLFNFLQSQYQANRKPDTSICERQTNISTHISFLFNAVFF